MPDETAPTSSGGGATETERVLIGIWERILGVRPVRRTDHFFTIGGDSLSAVTVILEVEANFEVSLTVRVLFEAPTLDRLADRVDSARSQPDKSSNTEFIFPLAERGRGLPVFFCSVDLKLAQKNLWRIDCPLYAVTLWAQGKGFVRAKSMEELAHDHIERIRSIQPHGPYRIAGFSFGGLVALEIAQQLRRAGDKIELLFLLDPSEPFEAESAPNPGERTGFAARNKRFVRRLARHPGETARRTVRQLFGPAQKVFWGWLCYQLLQLHGRNAKLVSTRLLPKNRWAAFRYASKPLARISHKSAG
jgi:acyl carrier protein